MIPNLFRAVLLVFMSILWAVSVCAEPIHKATFTLSGKQPLQCANCREGWANAIEKAFEGTSSAKLTTGHIVLIDLNDSRLQPLVTDRDPNNDTCRDFVGATRYDPDKTPQRLPVLLKTVSNWADSVEADIAFSGSNFKFQDQGGVRAKPACGEMIGVNLRNGYLDWPPAGRVDLLHEWIDLNQDWPAYAFLLNADRTAGIAFLESFNQLDNVAYSLGGSALYIDGWENPTPGSKPTDLIARLGVGILSDPTKIIVVKLEGDNRKTPGVARGHKLSRLRLLFQALGAVSAINLDGSGSAHIVVRNQTFGASSHPSDTEGARPIANHFGFQVHDEAVTWVSYGERRQLDDD